MSKEGNAGPGQSDRGDNDNDNGRGEGGYGGLGIGNPGSYGGSNDPTGGGNQSDGGGSYSSDAMESALAAANHSMVMGMDEGGYKGLGIGNPQNYGGNSRTQSQQQADQMNAAGSNSAMGQQIADSMNTATSIAERENTISDLEDNGFFSTAMDYLGAKKGTAKDYMGQALGRMATEGVGNFVGGSLGGTFMGPIGAWGGSNLGTAIVDREVPSEIAQELGLVDRVTGNIGVDEGLRTKEQTDSMVKRLMQNSGRRV